MNDIEISKCTRRLLQTINRDNYHLTRRCSSLDSFSSTFCCFAVIIANYSSITNGYINVTHVYNNDEIDIESRSQNKQSLIAIMSFPTLPYLNSLSKI